MIAQVLDQFLKQADELGVIADLGHARSQHDAHLLPVHGLGVEVGVGVAYESPRCVEVLGIGVRRQAFRHRAITTAKHARRADSEHQQHLPRTAQPQSLNTRFPRTLARLEAGNAPAVEVRHRPRRKEPGECVYKTGQLATVDFGGRRSVFFDEP